LRLIKRQRKTDKNKLQTLALHEAFKK